ETSQWDVSSDSRFDVSASYFVIEYVCSSTQREVGEVGWWSMRARGRYGRLRRTGWRLWTSVVS
ncbi:hypothetical protein NVV99_26005, partial [Rhodococcus sp. PAE-6]